MNKIIVYIVGMVLLLAASGAQASEYPSGGYWGAKIGVNYSGASGNTKAPTDATFAYLFQGGYLHGGYVFTSKTLLLGVGGFYDWNPNELRSSGIIYGSRSAGMDFKVGLPLGDWLPHVKLGYGYSTGTKDLNSVTGNSLSGTVGMEYKIDTQWSLLGELKVDGFGNNGTSISNKTLTFGFNYYFNAPKIEAAPVVPVIEEVFEEEPPKPAAVPVPVMDAPPI